MEWRLCYLDGLLVPLGLLVTWAYHAWLWHNVRKLPLTTVNGRNAKVRRSWVSAMMKDSDKKNILAVQTLRNTIMGSTLMTTTSILLCSALAAIHSSTYSVKKPLNEAFYVAHGEFVLSLKYATLLTVFLFSFLCQPMSVRFINQVTIHINIPQVEVDPGFTLTPEYVADVLERGFVLNTVRNRIFYMALPLLLWIFGPMLVFLCSITLVPVLYNLDFILGSLTTAGKVGDIRKDVELA